MSASPLLINVPKSPLNAPCPQVKPKRLKWGILWKGLAYVTLVKVGANVTPVPILGINIHQLFWGTIRVLGFWLIAIWWFPKIEGTPVPPTHPLLVGFSIINHTFWDTPYMETSVWTYTTFWFGRMWTWTIMVNINGHILTLTYIYINHPFSIYHPFKIYHPFWGTQLIFPPFF